MEVTERGRLIALLVPAAPAATARDALVSSGRLRPASAPSQLPPRRQVTGHTAAVLSELRSDR